MRSQWRTIESARGGSCSCTSLQVLRDLMCLSDRRANLKHVKERTRRAAHHGKYCVATRSRLHHLESCFPLWPTLLITPVAKPITGKILFCAGPCVPRLS